MGTRPCERFWGLNRRFLSSCRLATCGMGVLVEIIVVQ